MTNPNFNNSGNPPDYPDLSPEQVVSLSNSGAKIVGNLLLYTSKQIAAVPKDCLVVDLFSGKAMPAKTFIAQGICLDVSGLSCASQPCSQSTFKRLGLVANALVIGISGSIGSGKSLALEYFRQEGATVFSADDFAKEVVAPGSPGLQAIVNEFGSSVLVGDALDRKQLAAEVFADSGKRERLETILHPLIRKAYVEALLSLLAAPDHTKQLVVYEVPLLFESRHSFPELSEKILVSTDEALAIERLVRDRNMAISDITLRLNAQMSLSEKRELATREVVNSGSKDELKSKVQSLYQELLQTM
jgi:dephospho-CoA kinase